MASKYSENLRTRITPEQLQRIEELADHTELSKADIQRLGCDLLYFLHHLSIVDVATLVSEEGQIDESIQKLPDTPSLPYARGVDKETDNEQNINYNRIGMNEEFLGLHPSDADFGDTEVLSERNRIPILRQLLMTKSREEYSQASFTRSALISFAVSWFGVSERTARNYVDRLSHMGGVYPHISMHPEFAGRFDEMQNDVIRYFTVIGEKMGDEDIWYDVADAYRHKATDVMDLSGYASTPDMGISSYGRSIRGQWFGVQPRYYMKQEDAIEASQAHIARQFRMAPQPLSVEIAGIKINHRYSTHRLLTQLLVAGVKMGVLSEKGAKSLIENTGYDGFTESSIVPDKFS